MSDPEAELVFGEMEDDPQLKRSQKQKKKKGSTQPSSSVETSTSTSDPDDARITLLKSKLAEMGKPNINYDDDLDLPITSPVGSPGDSSPLNSFNELLKLKQQLEEGQAMKSDDDDEDNDSLDSFIDVQALLESLNPAEYTRPHAPKIDTNQKFNELCQQIRDRDAIILGLEAKVHEMDREAIDLKEMVNERDKLIGSKNEAVAVVQNKFKRELEEREFELKRTQQVLFDMEKTLSSGQNKWKQEKELLNAENHEMKVKNGKIIQKFKNMKEKHDSMAKEFADLKRTNEIESAKRANDEELSRQLSEKDEVIQQNNEMITELRGLYTTTKERLTEMENQATEWEAKLAKLSELDERVVELHSIEAEKNFIVNEYENSKEQMEQLRNRLDEAQRVHDDLVESESRQQKEIEALQVELAELQNISNRHETMMQTLANCEQDIATLSVELHEKTQLIEDFQSQREEFEAQLKKLEEEKSNVIAEAQSKEQQLIDQVNQYSYNMKMNQQHAQTLQQELIQKDQELMLLRQRQDQVTASDEITFQVVDEEKNSLVQQIEVLKTEIEQLKTTISTEQKESTENNKIQSPDEAGFINWSDQSAPGGSNWWASGGNTQTDWENVEQVQITETVSPGDQHLQYLQSQLNEKENQMQNLNYELESLRVSVNELNQGIHSLNVANQEISYNNRQLMDENKILNDELAAIKHDLDQSGSPIGDMSVVADKEDTVKPISIFQTTEAVAVPAVKEKSDEEIRELKVKNSRLIQRFKALKEKYDAIVKECENLKSSTESSYTATANDEEFLSKLREKDDLIQQNVEIIAQLQGLYFPTKERLTELESQAVEWEAKFSELTERTSKLSQLEAEKNSISNEYENSRIQMEQLRNRLDEAQNQLADSESKHVREIEALQVELTELQNVSNRHETMMQTLVNCEQQIASLSHELHEKTQAVEELQYQKSQIEAQLKTLEEEKANVISEAQSKEQQLIEQVNQYSYYMEMNQQHAQTLQQELIQKDQELTHMKEFYDPQIANLTSTNETLEQTKDELSFATKDLDKQQELVKELENSLAVKEEELRQAQVTASDEVIKFQVVVEEKNNLVQQIEMLKTEIEQLKTQTSTEQKQSTESSQIKSPDEAGFINWGDQSAAGESDWWASGGNAATIGKI